MVVGAVVSVKGKKHLGPERSAELVRRAMQGERVTALAAEFGVSATQVYKLVRKSDGIEGPRPRGRKPTPPDVAAEILERCATETPSAVAKSVARDRSTVFRVRRAAGQTPWRPPAPVYNFAFEEIPEKAADRRGAPYPPAKIRTVLGLLMQGRTPRQVADAERISETTVRRLIKLYNRPGCDGELADFNEGLSEPHPQRRRAAGRT